MNRVFLKGLRGMVPLGQQLKVKAAEITSFIMGRVIHAARVRIGCDFLPVLWGQRNILYPELMLPIGRNGVELAIALPAVPESDVSGRHYC